MQNVKVDDLPAAVVKMLETYSQDVTDGVKADVKTVARECREEIKKNSPEATGAYKKGWADAVEFEGKEDIRITVHNKKKPWLTSLLEYGHAKIGGGRVEGRPHIRPAEEHAAEKLEKKVKVVVKG